jgi:hypothetical protein
VSLFQRERVGVGIGATEVAVAFHSARSQLDIHMRAFADANDVTPSGASARMGALVNALEGLLDTAAGASRRTLQVVLTPACVRSWVMQTPSGVNSLGELQSIAQARCLQLFGDSMDGWKVTGDWRASGPILCAAVPSWLRESLESTLRTRNRPFRLQPFLSVALGRAAGRVPMSGWLCIRTPEHVILAHRLRGRLRTLRTISVDQGAAADHLAIAAAEARRESLRLALSSDSHITLLDCSGPSASGSVTAKDASFDPVAANGFASVPREAFASDATVCALAGVSW